MKLVDELTGTAKRLHKIVWVLTDTYNASELNPSDRECVILTINLLEGNARKLKDWLRS